MDVSRETRLLLERYIELLRRWNRSINLISRKSLDDPWHRHIKDSYQLCEILPFSPLTWRDLGSGAGFPGLVVAICKPEVRMQLVESDQRKAMFLRSVINDLNLDVSLQLGRIEAVVGEPTDVISARALAPLPQLLEYGIRHSHAETIYLFPKGATFEAELQEARRNWRFSEVIHPSITNGNSVVLELRNVEYAGSDRFKV